MIAEEKNGIHWDFSALQNDLEQHDVTPESLLLSAYKCVFELTVFGYQDLLPYKEGLSSIGVILSDIHQAIERYRADESRRNSEICIEESRKQHQQPNDFITSRKCSKPIIKE